MKFILEEKGETVEAPIEVGQELLVDRTRANPIKLGDVAYHYIHKNFVLGVVA